MARALRSDVVIDRAGRPRANVTVRFTPVAGTSATNKLWAAETGAAELASVVTDKRGVFAVWLDEGRYDELVEGGDPPVKRVDVINQHTVDTLVLGSGPEGPEGPPGPDGPQGPAGPQGDPGFTEGSVGIWGSPIVRAAGIDYVPSASQITLVEVEATSKVNEIVQLSFRVEGRVVGALTLPKSSVFDESSQMVSFIVPPGQAWKATLQSGAEPRLRSNYLPIGSVGGGGGGGVANLGIADPRSAPYNAKCDGTTDDTAAFKALHEAINAGTIPGYFIPGPCKITAALPTLTRTAKIISLGGSLDFSAMESSSVSMCLRVEGAIGAAAALTADAAVSAYELSVGTAYADGTLLKLYDPTTSWDKSQKALVGEIVEVGRPDGALSGFNGKTSEPAGLPATTSVTELIFTSLNPENVSGTESTQIIPASGEVEVGTDVFKYESWTISENKVKLKLEGAQEAKQTHKQGDKVTIKAPAGKVLLRTPVRHELGYTLANSAKVRPITPLDDVVIDNVVIKGAQARARHVGIQLRYCRNAQVNHPTVRDCWTTSVRFWDCIDSHIHDPFYENAREVEYAGGGLQGYGTNFSFATQDCTVRGGRSIRTRHAYTQGGSSTLGENGGLPRDNRVIDHTAVASFADAFDSHGGAYSVHFEGCTSIQSRSQGWNINCPKATLVNCRASRPISAGATVKNISLGAAEYDIDLKVIEPRVSNGFGLKVVTEETTYGKEFKFIKIRGEFDGCGANAVEVKGQGEGGSIAWYAQNVDIDVIVRGGGGNGGANAVKLVACEGVRALAQVSGYEKARTLISVQDCKNYDITAGPLAWSAESASNIGVKVTVGGGGASGGSTKGVIREGPMTSLGSGKSTELDNNTTHTYVTPGPDEAIKLGSGTGNKTLGEKGETGVAGGAKLTGKTNIATEESRENAAYGVLTTPDEVAGVVLPTDGVIAVMFQATWKESVASAGRACIFLDGNELRDAARNVLAVVDAKLGGTANAFVPLATVPGEETGLTSQTGGTGYPGDASTGQIVGSALAGGPLYIFAAAGTYKVSVRFKASSGSVTVKDRHLWVWAVVP